jgi:divalent metal cation (Fe/Co/Zn/Cd) transporter
MSSKKDALSTGLWLEYMTLAWNVVGFGLLLWAAYSARSVALAGFGIDSVIEIFASVVVVWQLRAINKEKEGVALTMIGFAFLLLATYICIQTAYSFHAHIHAATSRLGVAWLLITVCVMFLLAHGKAVVGAQLSSAVLQSEAKVTVVDGLLALAVLIGLLLSYWFSWWWADSAASLVVMAYGVKEGLHLLGEAKGL